jgi:hypothetical protein
LSNAHSRCALFFCALGVLDLVRFERLLGFVLLIEFWSACTYGQVLTLNIFSLTAHTACQVKSTNFTLSTIVRQ